MAVAFYPSTGTRALATLVQTALVNSVVRLFQDTITPTPSTTQAELIAEEADFSGYAAITVAAWLDPATDPSGNSSTQFPTVQFATTGSPPAIGNQIGGFWVETVGGDVMQIIIFDAAVPMDFFGAALPVDLLLPFLTGY